MFKTYFADVQVLLLVAASIFFLISLYFQIWKKNEQLVVTFLIATALCVFAFAALLDPFLNLWDERFHAIVAKNLVKHPLKPTLYDDTVISYINGDWSTSHIWLHKQPLFLWQMMISFKLFGYSEFALRIPSILLSTILVFISYRFGKVLFNKRVGYISALLTISSLYLTELVAGRQQTDHNDVAFLAYVSLSIWSLIEYYYSKKKIYLYLIGFFAGMAILCKWLVGLLVYLGWGALRIQEKKWNLRSNKDFFIALLTTILIALPWQIFTFIKYPTETSIEQKYNALHFIKIIEGHGGDFWYHFEQINLIYGVLTIFLIIPSMFITYKSMKDKKVFFALLAMILALYSFFSLAATKMPSFTLVVFMIITLFLAVLISYSIEKIKIYIRSKFLQKVVLTLSMIVLILFRFDIELLQEKHTTWKHHNFYTRIMIANKTILKSLNLPNNAALFNVKGGHYLEAMFYTGVPSYNFIPTKEQYDDLKRKDRVISIFCSSVDELPEYLKNDSSIIILKDKLQKL